MEYVYKTKRGAERKIGYIQKRIAIYKKLRGTIGNGTLWEDIAAVDEGIERMNLEISALQNHISNLGNPKYLHSQLKSSEIY